MRKITPYNSIIKSFAKDSVCENETNDKNKIVSFNVHILDIKRVFLDMTIFCCCALIFLLFIAILPTSTRNVFICCSNLEKITYDVFSRETLPFAMSSAKFISFPLLFRLILCPLLFLWVDNWWYFLTVSYCV